MTFPRDRAVQTAAPFTTVKAATSNTYGDGFVGGLHGDVPQNADFFLGTNIDGFVFDPNTLSIAAVLASKAWRQPLPLTLAGTMVVKIAAKANDDATVNHGRVKLITQPRDGGGAPTVRATIDQFVGVQKDATPEYIVLGTEMASLLIDTPAGWDGSDFTVDYIEITFAKVA